ncbi:MAG: AraC family transcriptional regulator [Sphingobacteriales bacterium]|nr:MAG: AraC family transcriptional regulator [Sphingobacteriales bacterium]
MVCNRCKMVVEQILGGLGLHPISIQLGEVVLQEADLDAAKQEALKAALQQAGFELLDDKKSLILEQIKTFIIETVHHLAESPTLKLSQRLQQHLQHDYSYLSKLFSEVEGITIEHYQLLQKIEKVKELLHYNEMSLSQIALDMGYSSTAHLSAQFKKLTGLTPTQFKQLGTAHRLPLDQVGKS